VLKTWQLAMIVGKKTAESPAGLLPLSIVLAGGKGPPPARLQRACRQIRC